jgi:hypothetical protein
MTREETFAYTESELLLKEIRAALLKGREAHGSDAATANAIGWSRSEVSARVCVPSLPDVHGTYISSLTLDDLRNRSKPQLRRKIRHARIQTLAHLGSNYKIAKVLGGRLGEYDVRRVKKAEALLEAALSNSSEGP